MRSSPGSVARVKFATAVTPWCVTISSPALALRSPGIPAGSTRTGCVGRRRVDQGRPGNRELRGRTGLINTPAPPPPPPPPARGAGGGRGRGEPPPMGQPVPPQSPYSMCYAVSVTSDPLGTVLPLRISAAALSRTIPGPQSGPTAITCRAVPATTSSRSTPALPTAPGCFRDFQRRNSVSSSMA